MSYEYKPLDTDNSPRGRLARAAAQLSGKPLAEIDTWRAAGSAILGRPAEDGWQTQVEDIMIARLPGEVSTAILRAEHTRLHRTIALCEEVVARMGNGNATVPAVKPAPAPTPKPAAPVIPAPSIAGSPSRSKPGMSIGTAPVAPAPDVIGDEALIAGCSTAFGRRPKNRAEAERALWEHHVEYPGAIGDTVAQARGWRRLPREKMNGAAIANNRHLFAGAVKNHMTEAAKPAIDPNLTGIDRVKADICRQLSIK